MAEKDSEKQGYSGRQVSEDQQNQLLFMMLVQQHYQIGMMGLGKIKNPTTDKIEKDLSSAKFAIDTLEMLKEFTGDNISKELKDYLNQTISTLQLNYVDEIEEENKSAKDKGE